MRPLRFGPVADTLVFVKLVSQYMVALLSNYIKQAESIILHSDPDTLLNPLFLSTGSLSTLEEINNDSSFILPLSYAIGGVFFIQLSCANKVMLVQLLDHVE